MTINKNDDGGLTRDNDESKTRTDLLKRRSFVDSVACDRPTPWLILDNPKQFINDCLSMKERKQNKKNHYLTKKSKFIRELESVVGEEFKFDKKRVLKDIDNERRFNLRERQKFYAKNYYIKNKDKINAKRREKYLEKKLCLNK